MRTLSRSFSGFVAAAALFASASANAALILNTAVTSTFGSTSTGTSGNDLPGRPSTLYFGQLAADQAGFVDFFYLGNEAGYTNKLVVGDSVVHTTSGLPDNFRAPYPLVGSVGVAGGQAVDFGFCTDGGAALLGYGRCAYNDVASSLTAQFNYNNAGGYRSIGFRSLTAFDPAAGLYSFGGTAASNLWMIFWDDSGARNDDDHDDYVAVARFRPVSVPEPGTLLLLGAGLLALPFARRARRNA